MYAVIRTGGKQYRVSEGAVFQIEKIEGEVGNEIRFEEVLMLNDDSGYRVGKPCLDGVQVKAVIVRQDKAPKVLHFRKEKEGWARRRGHRQLFSEVKIVSITV
ncbi:MAG: 50S ribosomal protein L21 [Cystobacterineae bacterium]|nr:50S ribosomal protein L21 [Cystobacterineae bacterium]